MALNVLAVFFFAETTIVGKLFGSITDYESLALAPKQSKETLPTIWHNLVGSSFHHDPDGHTCDVTTLPPTTQDYLALAKQKHHELRPGAKSYLFYAEYPGTYAYVTACL